MKIRKSFVSNSSSSSYVLVYGTEFTNQLEELLSKMIDDNDTKTVIEDLVGKADLEIHRDGYCKVIGLPSSKRLRTENDIQFEARVFGLISKLFPHIKTEDVKWYEIEDDDTW